MKKSVIACFVLVLAFGGIGLFRVQRVSAQATTTTEFDFDLHCSGPAPVVGGAQLQLTMSIPQMTAIQLNCSDTDRGATQHVVFNGTLVSFSGGVQAGGTGMGNSCSFAATSLPFETNCVDASSTPTRRVRLSIQ